LLRVAADGRMKTKTGLAGPFSSLIHGKTSRSSANYTNPSCS
jgi:hypothetical protein